MPQIDGNKVVREVLPAASENHVTWETIAARLKRWRLSSEQRRAVAGLKDAGPDQIVQHVQCLNKSDIIREYQSDAWLCNYLVNWWEFAHGETVLSTYPWNVTIPVADVCNARCTFCTSWLEGTRVLELDEVHRFGEVLRHARLLGIAGHGEPLAHPQCDELFEEISRYLDPRCETYVITNGVLLDRRADSLGRLNVRTYNISLNAATAATHDAVMGLGADAFDSIIDSVQRLVAEGKKHATVDERGIDVNISFVMNRDNIHELPSFIRLGNQLQVHAIYLRTLNNMSSLSPGLNYHLLPPNLHPEFETYIVEAKEAMAGSRAKIVTDVARWSAPVMSQDLAQFVQINPPPVVARKEAQKDPGVRQAYSRFYQGLEGSGQRLEEGCPQHDPLEDGSNPFGRTAPFSCYFVYHDFILNDFNLRLIPCCHMANVPGYEVVRFDGSRSFMECWNSPAFVGLRQRLREGPLYGACKKCPSQVAQI